MKKTVQKKSCMLDLPYCGHFAGSEESVFIAVPEKTKYEMEINTLNDLLRAKGLKNYIMPELSDQNKISFCERVCSKIISSRFCLVFTERNLARSTDVHLSYGIMLAFDKIVVPLEKAVHDIEKFAPLPAILYYPDNFHSIAQSIIEEALFKTSSKGLLGLLYSDEELQQYFLSRNLKPLPIENQVTREFYRIAYPADFLILEGTAFVFFGAFESLGHEEAAARIRLLIKGLMKMKSRFETVYKNTLPFESIEFIYRVFSNIRIEVLVSRSIDITKLLSETSDATIPVKLINRDAIRK
jgi:hypothetical protein